MSIVNTELVVDYTDLPEEIRNLIQEEYDGDSTPNRSYRWYDVHDEQKPRSEHKGGEILHTDSEIDYIVERGDSPLSDYFYDQGLVNRETIIILINW